MTDPAAAPAQPVYAAPTPGKGLRIAAFVFAFLIPLLGLILGIVSKVQSSRAGQKNVLAVWAIVISIVWPLALGGIIGGSLAAACANHAAGVTCSSSVG
jgi:hypothetical protein